MSLIRKWTFCFATTTRSVAAIKDSDSIQRYLASVGIDQNPASRGQPRFERPELGFDDWDQSPPDILDQISLIAKLEEV